MAGVRLGLLVELRQRVSVVIMVLLLVGVLQLVLVAQLRERGGGGYSGYQLTTLSTNKILYIDTMLFNIKNFIFLLCL